ncbi:hypothetical protein MKW92_032431 [Papaver armeniacum]|nr:hypothetical protein MKW92_032431 [Papaver armeniacum]
MAALGNIASLRLFFIKIINHKIKKSHHCFSPRPNFCTVGAGSGGILSSTNSHFARKISIREEIERRQAARQARVVPDSIGELVEYFLDTEARELEFEIARLRPRLNRKMTQAMEDRLKELEAAGESSNQGMEAEEYATAHLSDQKEAAFFMERVQSLVFKYITA